MPENKTGVILARRRFDAVIFDLDGVVAQTARLHAQAWKALFDEYREESGGRWQPFDPDGDYRSYVNDKPCYDGIRSFLASRDIKIPHGRPEDPPEKGTVCGLANKKNIHFQKLLKQDGVEVYDAAVRLIKDLRYHGFKTAIISSSKNCAAVLKATGLEDLFDVRVDGVVSKEMGLKAKPSPDIFSEATRRLGVEPERVVVLDDALFGVKAGRDAGVGLVIGVDRTDHVTALYEKGAHRVVKDLGVITVEEISETDRPSALHAIDEILEIVDQRRIVVFLDYDGTLTPIVEDPKKAVLSGSMKETLQDLALHCTVTVISGRDLEDVKVMVGIDGLVYSGSHGFEISAPRTGKKVFRKGEEYLPDLDQAERRLKEVLKGIVGVRLERKRFSIAVHFRQVGDREVQAVEAAVDDVHGDFPGLRKCHGKKIFELQPNIEWHKGKALNWVMGALDLTASRVLPFYLGDDVTDEDAFDAIRKEGVGIVITDAPRPSKARYFLRDPGEVESFLKILISIAKGDQ